MPESHNSPEVVAPCTTIGVNLMSQSRDTRIKNMVKDKVVRFKFYRDDQLFYQTEDGFEFPVPLDDVGNATFLAEDKAILFMRYIRRHIDTIEHGRAEQEAGNQ